MAHTPVKRNIGQHSAQEWATMPVGKEGRPFAEMLKSSHYRKDRANRWLSYAGFNVSEPQLEKILQEMRQYNREHANAVAPLKDPLPAVSRVLQEAEEDETQHVTQHNQGDCIFLAVEGKRIHTLEGLIAAAKIDPEQWDVEVWTANTYEAQRKGGGIMQMWQVKATLRRKPTWLLRPARPVDLTPIKPKKVTTKVKTCLVIPDSQNGYKWDDRYEYLAPMHDRRAWDIIIQVAKDLQPDRIDLLGDMVDVANLSTRYTRHPGLKHTTQPTIDELHWWLAQLRKNCPNSEILYHCGNHEDRLDRALSDLMPELIGLKRPGEKQAIHSWEHYLALDKLTIKAIPNYGDITWLWNRVAIHHGEVVRGGKGGTTKTVSRNAQYSEVFGHVHRLEHHIRTVHGPEGMQYVHAMTPGCLCKLDGEVPGVSSRPDWQQGFGVIYLVDNQVHMQAIPIQEGAAVFQNTVYRGDEQLEAIVKETGWHQFRPHGTEI